jgi:GntR family transcriptional regulator/MocR family aminotransferase
MSARLSGTLFDLLEQQPNEPAGVARRIQDAIRRTIVDGVVRQKERLPSTRTLAIDLGVARDTVEAAYQQLEAEGFVTRRQGSGTFVSALDSDILIQGRARSRKIKGGARLQSSLSLRGKEIWKRGGVVDQAIAVPFAAAMPDVKSFPADTWRHITARVLRQSGSVALMYGDAQGYLPLREEISRYLAARRGVRCKAEQVLILSSSQQALWLIATLLVDPTDQIAVEDPGYHGAKSAFMAAGAALLPVAVDEDGLRAHDLVRRREKIRAVYVTPSHQYPMGVTLSLDRRLTLIDWAQKCSGWIIEDDYDSEYRYDGRPISAIQGLDMYERVLYVGTLSKVLFPSLRLAYLVLPESLVAAFVTARTLIDGQSSLINQIVLAQFMNEGHFTAHIRRMRQLYRARRDSFIKSFETHLSPYATMAASAGGLQIACQLKVGLNERQTEKPASAAGVELPSLRRLYLGSRPEEGWLMGFAASTPGEISEAMRRLAKYLENAGLGASV